ncbi:MAG: Crp/Fnr family transcriptional regulator [Alphaproteobacteria bacterium]|nr:Crp/Fnr family transcriptional regulator [Alphaproteobacteria bacterium]
MNYAVITDRLSMSPIFAACPNSSLDTLIALGSEEGHPRGATLSTRGERSGTLHLIVSGQVGLYGEGPAQKPRLVNLLGPNEFVGLAEALLDHPSDHDCVALAPLETLAIPRDRMIQLLFDDWDLQMSLLSCMSQRLHGLFKQIHALKSQKAVQRVAAHLLERLDQSERSGEFRLTQDKKDLASFLGLAPESLSRALNHLRATGVEVRGKVVRIPDPGRLSVLLEGGDA